MGDTSSSIPVQGVIDFPIVYQHSFESPKSFKVPHVLILLGQDSMTNGFNIYLSLQRITYTKQIHL